LGVLFTVTAMNHWLLASWHLNTLAKSWAILWLFYVECALIGLSVSRHLSRWCTPLALPGCALLGVLTAGTAAQIFSFFGGLRYFSDYVILGVLAIDLALAKGASLAHMACSWRATNRQALWVLVPVSCIISANALTSAFGTDSSLYHLSEFRWMAEFGTVPGLANLHGRFGFNSVLAAIGGLLSTGVGLPLGREFANPLVVLIASAAAFEPLSWRDLTHCRPVALLSAATLPGLLVSAFSDSLSSPQADVASAAMAMAVGVLLARRLFVPSHDPGVLNPAGFELLTGLVLLVELKVSYAFFALGCGAVLFWLEVRRSRLRVLVMGGTALVILLPYLIRGYILSGYPLYPLEMGGLPFDWAVPQSAVRTERIWILSWARQPQVSRQEVMASSAWLGPWLRGALQNPILIRPLVLATFGVAALGAGLFRKPGLSREATIPAIMTFPPFLGLIGWFTTAPDLRFAEGTFWALAASVSTMAVFLNRCHGWVVTLFWTVVVALVLVETGSGWHRLSREPKRLPNWVGPPSVCVQRVTRSGLKVWVPAEVQMPGDAPLPSTAPDRFDPALEMRGETLRDGFRTQDQNFHY